MSQFGEHEEVGPESDGRWKQPKWQPTMERPLAPTRCIEPTKKGTQCENTVMQGSDRCGSHSTNLDRKAATERVELARLRMIGLVEPAMDVLEQLLEPGVNDAVRLKAAENIFDRAGLVKGAELNVNVENVSTGSKMVLDKMSQIRNRQMQEEEVVDVEEVSDDDSGE